MDQPDYQIDLSVNDVRGLYKSVCFHLEKWPGGDPYEQEHLTQLKYNLYRIIMDWEFHKES